MSTASIGQIRERAEAVKASVWVKNAQGEPYAGPVAGACQATVSILSAIYGNPSTQLSMFLERTKKGVGQDSQQYFYNQRLAGEIERVLDQGILDFEAGLTGSVRVQAKGEVLGDFVALAREALASDDSAAIRVASVLAAAALEETLKQLGSTANLDVANRDLRGVIQKLKDGGLLVGAQSGVASGLVKFRDHAFHGQFELIERSSVESALSFVQGLLLADFS